MTSDEVRQLARNAKWFISAANDIANEIAPLLEGRLRHCDASTLQKLKRELRGFNIHTCKWSDS